MRRFLAGRAMLGLIVLAPICFAQINQPPTPGKVRVAGRVEQKNLKKSLPPVYPAEARRAGVTGAVVMAVLIDKEGNVEQVKPISGDARLIPAAVASVQHWKYKPFILNGEALAVETTVTVNFKLR